jgi:hypothetical protein
LVNEKTLNFLANLARENQIVDTRWDHVTAHVKSKFLKPETFTFSFVNLCVATASKEQEVCWKNADFTFKLAYAGLKPKLGEVGPVKLLAGEVTFKPSEKPKAATQAVSLSDQLSKISSFLGVIRGVSLHSVYASLHHEQAKIDLEADGDKFNISTDLNLKNWALESGQFMSAGLHFSVSSKQNKAQIEAKLSGKVLGKVRNRPKIISATLDGEVLDVENLDQIQLKLNGMGRNIVPEVAQMGLRDCTIKLHKIKSPSFDGSVKVSCPVWAELPTVLEDHYKLSLKPRLQVKIESDFESTEYPISPASEVKGKIKLEMTPLSAPWFKGYGKMEANFDGILKKFPDEWKTDSDLAINLKVSRFDALVKNFSKTRWAVPAPFHVLKGGVAMDIEGKSDLFKGSFPIVFKSRLKSENQKLNLDGQGTFDVSGLQSEFHSNLDFDLLFSNVALELPKLDLAAPPRIMPERRFSLPRKNSKETQKVSKSLFSYNLQLKTPSNNPVRILSNLAKTPVPVNFQLLLNSEYLAKGFVRVRDFPLKVFRRDATLDHFDVTLQSPVSESKIDGLINVKYIDYTVSILVASTFGKPAIKLISDPPLAEDKLVATLLFGKPMEELDAEQEQSVGSTRAAIADKALGIASLYALASTPVQSVGYDSTSQLFTAKLRLGEGTSLNLGADTNGIEGVGIRKRLGSKWSITTDISNSKSGDQNKAVSTFLEWVHRY